MGTPITTDGRGTATWRRFGDHVARDVLARRPERAGDLGLDALCVVVFGALAGVAIGLWTGGPHVLYVATKVPLLFGGTLLIGFPSMLVLGRLIGCPLSAEQAARLSLTTIARTATVLGGLAPASACFTLSLALGGKEHYQTLVLTQVFAFAVAGFAGVTALGGRLRAFMPDASARRRTVVLWIGIYSFVGAQMTWLLRPFLATPGLPLEYVRSYGPLGVESNFYLSVWQIVGGWLTS